MERSPAHSPAPKDVAQYRIIRALGQGGMGAVYLAFDTRLDREVALKILPAEVADDPERLNRFIQEAKVASSLNHPNVAYIYEIGQAGATWFIAMEYVEGEPLNARFAAASLTSSEIVKIGMDVADALDAAHAKGVVHRDIKPANLILTPRGHVKVLDFGLAKLERAKADSAETRWLTQAGVVMGTVQYMSPEQALGRDVDQRSDIFSLGIVLYEAATGRLPFAGANSAETIAAIIQSVPDAIARFNYELPQELERVIRKCLEKERERRYQSARELYVDLKNLERDSNPPAGTPGSQTAAGVVTGAVTGVIRAVIVDDEELARQILREYVEASRDIEVVAECANGFEAVKAITEHRPDIVFLDVQMPKLDGFEVLELIGRDTPVVFVTAYDQYAMRAFDAHAVDYLLKPFSLDRFRTALDRARQRIGKQMPPATELAAAARPQQQYAQRIVVKDNARVHVIPVDRLDYVEAQDDYVALHTQGKAHLKQQTISSIEATLDPDRFVRIHRSYLVNIERVDRIEPYSKDSKMAVLIIPEQPGVQLPVSRAGYERLKALLQDRN